MTMFELTPEDEFFGHIVTHDTTEQPGRLPRVVHTAHCNLCDEEIKLHGETPELIHQAYLNALHAHHIQVLAKRLKDAEQTARHPEGSELLGG